jgi:sulfite reductase (ferredoxin)
VVKVPARRVPEAMARLLKLYAAERAEGDTPDRFFRDLAGPRVEALLHDLVALDADTPDDIFLDIGQAQGFHVAIGEGECAA